MSSKESVIQELVAQIEELQSEVQHLKCLSRLSDNVWRFEVLSEEPLIIRGIALKEGKWNGVFYPSEELKKAMKQLEGKPILVEHGRDEKFKDREVGRVTKVKWEDLFKGILFEAEIDDPEAKKLVKEGEFKAVSMSTYMSYKNTENGTEGYDFQFRELSLVRNPACSTCFIIHTEEGLSNKDKSIYHREGDIGMEELAKIENKAYEFLQSILKHLPEELRDHVIVRFGEDSTKIPEEARAVGKKIVIYYGYPYPYGYYGYYYPYGYYKYPEKMNIEDILAFISEKLGEEGLKELQEYLKKKKKKKEEEYPYEYPEPEEKSQELSATPQSPQPSQDQMTPPSPSVSQTPQVTQTPQQEAQPQPQSQPVIEEKKEEAPKEETPVAKVPVTVEVKVKPEIETEERYRITEEGKKALEEYEKQAPTEEKKEETPKPKSKEEVLNELRQLVREGKVHLGELFKIAVSQED